MALTESHTNVLCKGNTTGAIDLDVTGGTAPYTYAWAPNAQTTQDISAIAAGNYDVTVTDANGCKATLSVTISEPAAPLATTITQTNVACHAGNTGAIDLAVTGGTGP